MKFRIATDGVDFRVEVKILFGWRPVKDDGRVLTFRSEALASDFKQKVEARVERNLRRGAWREIAS